MKFFLKSLNFFKKLKLLDYLIITVLILAILIGYQFFNPEEKWIEVSLRDNKVPLYQSSFLKKGDFELSPMGDKEAIVNDVSIYYNDSKTKALILNVKLKTKVNRRTKELEYKNKIIKVGSPIELSLNTGLFKGDIISFEGAIPLPTTRLLTLRLFGQWPWFADSLQVGAGESIKDGSKIFEIISKEVTPAEIVVDTASGNRIITTDPQKVDITLLVKVQVRIIDGEAIYKQYKNLNIGENFYFNTGKTQVWEAVISNIE